MKNLVSPVVSNVEELSNHSSSFLFGKNNKRRVRAASGETRKKKNIILNKTYQGQSYEVTTFLHELLHTAKSNHYDIAKAITNLEGVENKWKKYAKKNLRNNDKKRQSESTNFINNWLNKNCVTGDSISWERNLKAIGAVQ